MKTRYQEQKLKLVDDKEKISELAHADKTLQELFRTSTGIRTGPSKWGAQCKNPSYCHLVHPNEHKTIQTKVHTRIIHATAILSSPLLPSFLPFSSPPSIPPFSLILSSISLAEEEVLEPS